MRCCAVKSLLVVPRRGCAPAELEARLGQRVVPVLRARVALQQMRTAHVRVRDEGLFIDCFRVPPLGRYLAHLPGEMTMHSMRNGLGAMLQTIA